MLLSVFTRQFSRDRACRRCNCPKWVGGQVNGYYFAAFRLRGGDRFGAAHPTPADPPTAPRTEIPEPRVPKPRPRVTVAKAVDAYLADAGKSEALAAL